jgi:tetratricopeptide (TPR) repeat protein
MLLPNGGASSRALTTLLAERHARHLAGRAQTLQTPANQCTLTLVPFELILGRTYEEAVKWLRRSIELNRNYSTAQFYLAAGLARCGDLVEAQAIAAAALGLDRTFTIRRFRSNASGDNPVYLAGREHAIEGMRMAGVPEG